MSVDYTQMSDEEFLEQEAPIDATTDTAQPVAKEEDASQTVTEPVTIESVEDPVNTESDANTDSDIDPAIIDETKLNKELTVETTKVDPTAFVNKLFNEGFNASGKNFKPKSEDEVLTLLQKGVDYTKKTQELAKHRKLIASLEKHELLDDDKINFVIDLLGNKNPEAIKKLVKDVGINASDLEDDYSWEDGEASNKVDYQGSNNLVSQEELAFTDVLNEVKQVDGGNEIINDIYTNWDEKSKSVVWSDPTVMKVLANHKQQGIYEPIVEEINRKVSLGLVDLNKQPYIELYESVGVEMFGSNPQPSEQAPQPIARGTGKIPAGKYQPNA